MAGAGPAGFASFADFGRRWSALHGGVPPRGLVGAWLRLVWPAARALRRVPPLALTLAGLALGWLAVWPAAAGWPALGACAVLAGAWCDALDGAVAVLAGRASAPGAVADAVADRLTEAAYAVALWLAGAPGWLAAAAAGTGWLHEYLRERAGAGVLAVTVAERPTRVLFGCFGLVAAAVAPGGAAVGWAVAGWAATGALGLGQLAAAARRELSDPGASVPAMSTIPARTSIITLGVRDLAASIAFYEALGWRRSSASNDDIAWFGTADSVLGLFGHAALAEDAGVPEGEPGPFRGITLAINLAGPAEVDAAMAVAERAGATVVTAPEKVFWGGYRGYFADPDGHLWELAHNPFIPLTAEGRLDLP